MVEGNDPCQKEKDNYQKAIKEWDLASKAAKEFRGTKPVNRPGGVKAKSLKETKRMIQAHALRDEKEEAFKQADARYAECQERHKAK